MRRRTWEIIETAEGQEDRASHYFDIFLMTLIVLNVLAVILESVDSLSLKFGAAFQLFEIISVGIFTLEYLLRAWSCVEQVEYAVPLRGRLRYLSRPMLLVDLLAILPFYLGLFSVDGRFLRVLRLLRILRILKLARYYRALHLMSQVVRDSKEELLLSVALMGMILLLSSCLVYYFEHPAQPQAFPDIPSTLWWGIVTLTTVGYGDVFPITTGGRLLTSVIVVLAVGLFALPAGILGSGFVDALQQQREPERKQAKNHSDGQLAPPKFCPHCGHPLPQVNSFPESTDAHGTDH